MKKVRNVHVKQNQTLYVEEKRVNVVKMKKNHVTVKKKSVVKIMKKKNVVKINQKKNVRNVVKKKKNVVVKRRVYKYIIII